MTTNCFNLQSIEMEKITRLNEKKYAGFDYQTVIHMKNDVLDNEIEKLY